MQTVGKFCELKDHHPEWTSLNGGKSISVKLTSHFANNKVTLFDFELAEHMNQVYSETKSSFKMFQRFQERQMVNLCIGVGTFVFLYSYFQWMTSYSFESDTQRGKPLPRGHVKINLGPGAPGDGEQQALHRALSGQAMPVMKSLFP